MKKLLHNTSNLSYLLRPYWKYGKIYMIGLFFFTVIIVPIKSLASVLFIQFIIDAVGKGMPFSEILLIIFYYLGFSCITLILNEAFDNLYAEKKLVEIDLKINLEIYKKIIATDYKYFDDAEFYNNYTWAVNEYTSKSQEAVKLFSNIFQSITKIITMMAYIAVLGPWLIVISVVQITVTTLIEMRRNKINMKKREEIVPIDRKMGYVHRVLYQKEYVDDVKCTNLKRFLFDMYNNGGEKKMLIIKKYALTILSLAFTNNFINVIYDAAIMGYISYGIVVSKKIVGIGKFMGLLSANGQFFMSLYSFYGFLSQSYNLSLYTDKIRTFFETKSTIETETAIDLNASNDETISEGNAFSIELINVGFSYSNFSLKNINMKINPGNKFILSFLLINFSSKGAE